MCIKVLTWLYYFHQHLCHLWKLAQWACRSFPLTLFFSLKQHHIALQLPVLDFKRTKKLDSVLENEVMAHWRKNPPLFLALFLMLIIIRLKLYTILDDNLTNKVAVTDQICIFLPSILSIYFLKVYFKSPKKRWVTSSYNNFFKNRFFFGHFAGCKSTFSESAV